MLIEGKYFSQTCTGHESKTDAVNEAQASATSGEHGGHPDGVQTFVNPLDPQDGSDVLIERANGIHPKPVLDEGRRLHEDIAGRHEGECAAHEAVPFGDCPRMLIVVGIENGVKRGGIYEDTHLR